MMNPDTNELHPVGDWPLDTPQAIEKARTLGWLEFRVGETLTIKGKDFKVEWLGKDAILLQPVRTTPSLIEELNKRAEREAARKGWGHP